MQKRLLIFGGVVFVFGLLVGALFLGFRIFDRLRPIRAQFVYPVSDSEFKTGFEFKNAVGKNTVGFQVGGPIFAATNGQVRVGRIKQGQATAFDVLRISEGDTELVYLFASNGTFVQDGERVESGQTIASAKEGVALPYFVSLPGSQTTGLAIMLRKGGGIADLSLSDFAPFRGSRPEGSRNLPIEPRETKQEELAELLGTSVPSYSSPPVERSEFSAIPVFIGGQPFLGLSPEPGTSVLAITGGTIDITQVTDSNPPFYNIFILAADGLSFRYMVTGKPVVADGATVSPGDQIGQVGAGEVPITIDGGGRYRLLVGGQDASGYPISITPDMFLER